MYQMTYLIALLVVIVAAVISLFKPEREKENYEKDTYEDPYTLLHKHDCKKCGHKDVYENLFPWICKNCNKEYL